MRLIVSSHKEVSRPEFYMFATFTARHGRKVAEQLAENAAGHRFGHGPDSGARSSRGGSSARFPKMTDDAIKKYISGKDEVPEGFFRQYFCRVDNSRSNADVVAEVEIPIGFRNPKVTRAGQKTNMEMTRDKKFSLGEFDAYLHSVRVKRDEMGSMLVKAISKEMWNENLHLSGPEQITYSATDSRSEGGILIIKSGEPLPRYCPECSAEFFSALGRGTERMAFPPVPTVPLAMDNRLFCTENKHKEHGEEDCIGLEDLCSEINRIRIDQGKDEWRLVKIEAKEIDSRHSGVIWIDRKLLPR